MAAATSTIRTVVFTDIEGSTSLVRRLGAAAYGEVLAEHRGLIRAVVGHHGGEEVDTQGDSFLLAFESAIGAAAAAAEIQTSHAAHSWPQGASVLVRIGVHTGEFVRAGGRYVGLGLSHGARIMGAGYGGQILVSAATERLVREELPPFLALRHLGEFRLKDLGEAQPLYELRVNGLPSDFPPPRTLEARRHNLPLQATSFIGREAEIAELGALLCDPGTRLVAITGPGGTGKTRLALQVAADLIDRFADGAFVVRLAPVRDPALVVDAVAEAVEVPRDGSTGRRDLIRFLRDREMLLVLDNFEHLLPASATVAALLQAASGVTVLATSRERLHLAGERVFELLPFQVGDPTDAGELLSEASVALFIDRAQRRSHRFQPLPGDTADIAEICRSVDGLPLAIELAAAQTGMFSPQALRARLAPRLSILSTHDRDVDARQRTLRATIQWSCDLLTPAERDTLAWLSIFDGGARVDAVTAIHDFGGPSSEPVLGRLDALLDKNLLRRRDDFDGEPRLSMLETIREFASELLDPDSRERAIGYAIHIALDVADQLDRDFRSGKLEDRLDLFKAEADNLRAALRWTEARNDISSMLQLTTMLWPAFQWGASFAEAASWLEQGLSHDAEIDDQLRGRALCLSAVVSQQRGDAEGALALADRALPLVEGDAHVASLTEHVRAYLLRGVGDVQASRAALAAAERWARGGNAKQALMFALMGRAMADYLDHDYALARRRTEEALELAGPLSVVRPTLLSNLADLAMAEGNFDQAEALLDEANSLAASLGIRGESIDLNRAWLALLHGDPSAARPHLERTRSSVDYDASLELQATVLLGLAATEAAAGNTAAASELWQQAREAKRRTRQPWQDSEEQLIRRYLEPLLITHARRE